MVHWCHLVATSSSASYWVERREGGGTGGQKSGCKRKGGTQRQASGRERGGGTEMEGEKMGPGAHSKRGDAKDCASQMLPQAPAAQEDLQSLRGSQGPQGPSSSPSTRV